MSKKWIFLTCVLSLGSVETSQAHPLDSRDIVYIDGVPCNSACQSYMAWSRQMLSASGHQAPTQLRQRPASRHRSPRNDSRKAGPRGKAGRAIAARQGGMVPPADNAAGKPDGPPDKLGAEANFNTTRAVPEHVATAHAQQATAAPRLYRRNRNRIMVMPLLRAARRACRLGTSGKPPSPPDNDNNPATLPAVDAATDLNIRTLREQVTAAAAVPAPAQKADNSAQSDRPETIGLGDTNKATSAPPYDVAALEPTASAAAEFQYQNNTAAGDCRHGDRGARDDVARCRKSCIWITGQRRPDGRRSYRPPGNQRDIRSDRQGHCDRRQVFCIPRQGSHRNRRSGSGRNPAQRRANEGDRSVAPRRSAGSGSDLAISRNGVSRIRRIQDLSYPARASLTDRAALASVTETLDERSDISGIVSASCIGVSLVILVAGDDFRSSPRKRTCSQGRRNVKGANWRLMRRRNFNSLLDHFVGAGEQRCAETFTTSSVFVICCIGSLDGLSPLSMRAA